MECQSGAMDSDHETSVVLPKATEARPGVVEDYCGVSVADSRTLEANLEMWKLIWHIIA
jgi:hypothetical protein